MYRELLGGMGLGARLLFDRIPADADPLGPDNILGFFPGLLTGTPLFGQRFQVVAKSPKNGGWGDANCGGDFGPMLKFVGYDGILFSGQAEKPVYLYIDDDTLELRDASDYWGGLAIAVEDRFKEELGKKVSVAVIGPAGEKLNYMAGIANERGRLAARSGVGAVMGSKLLKAHRRQADEEDHVPEQGSDPHRQGQPPGLQPGRQDVLHNLWHHRHHSELRDQRGRAGSSTGAASGSSTSSRTWTWPT